MIYFVDEDINETEPFAAELEARGYDAAILDNADNAFEVLVNASNIELILLDVMLATEEGSRSRYSSQKTDGFITTGLTLLDELVENSKCKEMNNYIPKRVVLFSAASRSWVVEKIKKKSDLYNIAYLDKKEYSDVVLLADKIQEILSNVR